MRPICGVDEVLGIFNSAWRPKPLGSNFHALRAKLAIIEPESGSTGELNSLLGTATATAATCGREEHDTCCHQSGEDANACTDETGALFTKQIEPAFCIVTVGDRAGLQLATLGSRLRKYSEVL